MDATVKKNWYSKWWGILLTIVFFYVLVPYLVWTKTTWNKWIKIGITVLCILVFISIGNNAAKNKEDALKLAVQAETYLSEQQIDKALESVNQSKELYSSKDNPAIALEEKIKKVQSEAFLKDSLMQLNDNEVTLLKEGKLEKVYVDNANLNKIFIAKLSVNINKREEYITAQKEEEAKKKEAEAIKQKEDEAKQKTERIEKQFSKWDGSHIELTKLIKAGMNNPKSYEHVMTTYAVNEAESTMRVTTAFRGTNAFGAIVTNTIVATMTLDGDNIQIIE
ncbi:MAG: hypothetical protein ACK4NC_01775 [Candidatus Gracilibacteria bacterium]